jgi:hypothetical protein
LLLSSSSIIALPLREFHCFTGITRVTIVGENPRRSFAPALFLPYSYHTCVHISRDSILPFRGISLPHASRRSQHHRIRKGHPAFSEVRGCSSTATSVRFLLPTLSVTLGLYIPYPRSQMSFSGHLVIVRRARGKEFSRSVKRFFCSVVPTSI